LFGKLREHEMELHRLDESEMESRKKKGLSLKVQAQQSKTESDSCSDQSSSESEEPEIGLLVKKFKKFLKKKDNKFRKPSSSKTTDNKTITCYECGKTGHIKSECYKLQNKNRATKSKGKEPVTKTRKAYIAWNDNDESSASSDEEEVNLCLMADTDSESENEVSSQSNPTYDELQEAFNELHDDYVNSIKQLLSTKKMLEQMNIEHKEIENLCEQLKKDSHEKSAKCIELEHTVASLKSDLLKFANSKDKLNVILSNQRHVHEKSGLGYTPNMHVKRNKNRYGIGYMQTRNVKHGQKSAIGKSMYDIFTKPNKHSSFDGTCHFCCRKGHFVSNCKFKKLANRGWKQVWIAKKYVFDTNHPGPNLNWGPKTKF